jgi:hypothetical protein
MCDAIGHPVTHLKRVAIGPIQDSRLKPGQWRELTEAEVERLRKAAAQSQDKRTMAGSRRPPRPAAKVTKNTKDTKVRPKQS